jgi:hypothetical protein
LDKSGQITGMRKNQILMMGRTEFGRTAGESKRAGAANF